MTYKRCSEVSCRKKPIGRGLCSTHYQRMRARALTAGEWDPAPRPGFYDGGEFPCPECAAGTYLRSVLHGRRYYTCAQGHRLCREPDGTLRKTLTHEDMRKYGPECQKCGYIPRKPGIALCARCEKARIRATRVYRETHLCPCGGHTASTGHTVGPRGSAPANVARVCEDCGKRQRWVDGGSKFWRFIREHRGGAYPREA